MILAVLGPTEMIVVLAYLAVLVYLGWLAYRRTHTAADYLLAGRQAHPFIMALSYGATFISTSAIVGFGGVAGMFGMSLLWLTFLNIFVGVFIAFVFLGGPTRRMGHRLDAHTFPELLGRRFDSRAIQVFAGLVIFLFIPLYAAAVLIGGTEYISTYFGIDYNAALLVFAVITAAYVIAGGLKAVMYTDALQGAIMFLGMGVLLVWTYTMLGGVQTAHEELSAMASVPTLLKSIGHQGWMAMPAFGWGDKGYDLWWIVVSTIVLGVGIGVLAQPQLAVRFMTVKSKQQLNRAVIVGGVFILMMTGVAFTVGSVSNLYFYKHEKVTGRLIGVSEKIGLIAKEERDLVSRIPCDLAHVDTTGTGKADTHIVLRGHDVTRPDGNIVPFSKILPQAVMTDLGGGRVEIQPRATAFTRAVVEKRPGEYAFNTDSIIPTYITSAMPKWFGLLFLLTLLSAAMSTLSSQFHAVGTSIGRDVYEQLARRSGKVREDRTVVIVRIGIVIGLILAVLIGNQARGGYIVARATAIFFGLCASTFLPSFLAGLFWRRATRAGVLASMTAGFVVTAFWLVFIKETEARALGICKTLFGTHSLLADKPNWPVVDPLLIALPVSVVVLIVVSLFTRRLQQSHVVMCFSQEQAVPPTSAPKPQPVSV